MPKAPLKLISYKLPKLARKYAYLVRRGRVWHAIWVGLDKTDFTKSRAYAEWTAQG
jgi:hypothetical protein